MLYTNIGRGHPFYLDGVVLAVTSIGQTGAPLRVEASDVFRISRGTARMAWHAARWLYRHGASGGVAGALYSRLRRNNDYSTPSRQLNLMARDIRRAFLAHDEPLLVAHPSLVGMLAGRPNLLYQHGELVAPSESLVPGAAVVYVPTAEVAERFVESGYRPDQVVVTGLCIEPGLAKAAERAHAARVSRLENSTALTGLFFSSGAEPRPHLVKLVAAIRSAMETGASAIVLARRGGELARACSRIPGRFRSHLYVTEYCNRAEQDQAGEQYLPQADYIVGPAHERTNWAVGLGVPMFTLLPTIGPFAPLNLHLLLETGVARSLPSLDDSRQFGATLQRLRGDGSLVRMAGDGWGRHELDGFRIIARHVHENVR